MNCTKLIIVFGFQYAVRPLKPKLIIVSQSTYLGDFLSIFCNLNETKSSWPSTGRFSKMKGNLLSPLLSVTCRDLTCTSTFNRPGCTSNCKDISSMTVSSCQSYEFCYVDSLFANLYLVLSYREILGALNWSANCAAFGLCCIFTYFDFGASAFNSSSSGPVPYVLWPVPVVALYSSCSISSSFPNLSLVSFSIFSIAMLSCSCHLFVYSEDLSRIFISVFTRFFNMMSKSSTSMPPAFWHPFKLNFL